MSRQERVQGSPAGFAGARPTDTVPAGARTPSARTARTLRLLGVSGRRLLLSDGVWGVFPKGDRRLRPLVQLVVQEVERLKAEKLIVAAASGGYVLAPDNQVAAYDPDAQPAAGLWIFHAAGMAGSKLGGQGFARMAVRARLGEGPLTLRQTTAGQRLVEDVEQASRGPSLTMDWDAAPADNRRRSGGSGGRIHPARQAQQRIERMKSLLGDAAFALVHAACVQSVPIRVLERRFGLVRRAGARTLAAALEKVAEIYDGKI